MEIGEIESGKVVIKVLTTNTTLPTLLNDIKFEGKVEQPLIDGSKYIGEHGLALRIEVSEGDKKRIFLLDLGGTKNSIIDNASVMGVHFDTVEKVILSHGHPDHWGGMMSVLPKLKAGTEIILSPEAYNQMMILVPKSGKPYSPQEISEKLRDLQKENAFSFDFKLPPLSKSLLEKLVNENKLKILETREPIKLSEGIVTSGEIELFDKDEVTKEIYLMKSRKEFSENIFRDEIAIYINIKEKGLIILTGCGHTGIVNIIKHGQKLTGVEKIYAVIGGFHKEWESPKNIEKSVEIIKEMNPTITCGMHCTGFEFNKLMSNHPSNVIGIVGTEFHL